MACHLSILVSYFLIFTNNAQTTVEPICIWQETENAYTYINGLYVWNDTAIGDAGTGFYQKKDEFCEDGANDVYLYKTQSTWHIGQNLGSTDTFTGLCSATNNIDSPENCGHNWAFEGVTHPSLSVTKGSCPLLPCAIVTVQYWSTTHCLDASDDCCGDYDIQPYEVNGIYFPNVFRKNTLDGYGRYLYFSAQDFRWMCSKWESDITYQGHCMTMNPSWPDPNVFLGIDAYSLNASWHSLAPSHIRKFTWNSNRNQSMYLECGTVAPSPAPTQSPVVNYTISVEEFTLFQAEMRDEFDNSGNDKPLLAQTVRLVFSDCIGPKEWVDYDEVEAQTSNLKQPFEYNTVCDGCVYFRDDFNKGLRDVADDLIYIYESSENGWSEKMSTADFWMNAGTVAIEYGIELSGVTDAEEYPYYTGRRECTESPRMNINETMQKSFSFQSYDSVVSFFESDLNFTRDEMLTLMGAHTLGQARQSNSGFSGQWTENVDYFNNEYYSNLLSIQWEDDPSSDKWIVYGCEDESVCGVINMLNSDMFMGYQIEDSYDYLTEMYGCIANPISDSVEECQRQNYGTLNGFKDSNSRFLTEFREVWIRLVTMGYDRVNDLTQIETTVVVETFSTTEDSGDDANMIKCSSIVGLVVALVMYHIFV